MRVATGDRTAAERGGGPAAIVRWFRIGAAALAWLFAVGVVGQAFLAGMSVFVSPVHWLDHVEWGHRIGWLTVPLLVFAGVGRLPPRLIGLAALVLLLYGLQYLFANAAVGHLAALHPVNALVLFWLAVHIARRAPGTLTASD